MTMLGTVRGADADAVSLFQPNELMPKQRAVPGPHLDSTFN